MSSILLCLLASFLMLCALHSREEAGTAGLDGLDLSRAPPQAAEAGRKLAAVEDLALARLDGAEGRAGLAANGAAGKGALVEGAVLLSLLAVAGKGVRQGLGGSGRVSPGSVVDVCWHVGSVAGPSEKIE